MLAEGRGDQRVGVGQEFLDPFQVVLVQVVVGKRNLFGGLVFGAGLASVLEFVGEEAFLGQVFVFEQVAGYGNIGFNLGGRDAVRQVAVFAQGIVAFDGRIDRRIDEGDLVGDQVAIRVASVLAVFPEFGQGLVEGLQVERIMVQPRMIARMGVSLPL